MLRHGRYARGGSDTRDYCSQPAAARSTDARETRPRTTPTCRARRIRLTSCQTARASAHRAVHLDGPNTKARACPWRLTTPRRWAMTPSNDSIPAEGEAFRKAYVPRRCVLPLSWLFTISPAILRRESSAADNTLFALRRKLKKYSESPKVYGTERWIKKVRLRIDARSQRPIRLTALVARQRRVKLTSNFHSSAGRRAGLLRVRNHGDESVVRQQGR